MEAPGCRTLLTPVLIAASLFLLAPPAPADEDEVLNAQFPRPPALSANVDFWKRTYTEFGVGDFILHDRQNLAVIYDVVRVSERSNEVRAFLVAAPEIERVRGKYQTVLNALAEGSMPDEWGEAGQLVARLWGCPCEPEILQRAALNIRAQQGQREKVDAGLKRAKALMPQIISALQRHKVPHELAALPLVESTFNPGARSKAGAVGLWQFIPSTGKRYLTITRRRDDRRDPIRATDAAARLLKHNYETLGSWPLALVAYNHGCEGVMLAKNTMKTSAIEEIIGGYTGPRFGFASRNFYPEFLAALDVVHPMIHASASPPSAPHQTLKRRVRIKHVKG